jgi:predicted nucleic acid-binding protein
LLRLYLDTSAILKRYVTEPGTETTDIIYGKAETGELTITISLWNIGEALGVLDEKRRKRWLTEKEFEQTLKIFADELLKLIRLKTIEVNTRPHTNPNQHMEFTDDPSHIRSRCTPNGNMYAQQKRRLNK